MSTEEAKVEKVRSVSAAIREGNANTVVSLLSSHPELVSYTSSATISWLHKAASYGHIEVARYLVQLGLDVNRIDHPAETSPLASAIFSGHVPMAEFLLSHEADPNIGRTLIAAINVESEDTGLALVKLLVKHGVDINCVFSWFDDVNASQTPLSWAMNGGKEKITAYLKSLGAALPPKRATPPTEAVVEFFREHFGPVHEKSLTEVVPTTDPPITIHAIPPSKTRNQVTLFTTGMSSRPMAVPKGQEDYQYAELFIQLPADWPLTKKALADPNTGWPIRWLRQIAAYPHANETWLGGPVTIIANGEPPERLAPKCKFTSLLIMVGHSFTTDDGRTIQLYRLTPLYTEERALEMSKGVAELMRRFDKHDLSTIVDLDRINVAKSGR